MKQKSFLFAVLFQILSLMAVDLEWDKLDIVTAGLTDDQLPSITDSGGIGYDPTTQKIVIFGGSGTFISSLDGKLFPYSMS